jgi:hypothetical protein
MLSVGACDEDEVGEISEPPAAVVLSSPTDVTDSTLVLTWSRSTASDFATYRVYQAQANTVDSLAATGGASGLVATIPGVADTTHTVTDLADSTTYFFAVAVTDQEALVSVSNVVSATTTVTAPPESLILIAADREGEIYAIDPATGAGMLLLDTFIDDGLRAPVDLGPVSSMIANRLTGDLWVGMGGSSSAFCEGCILVLDTMTGEATSLNDTTFSGNGVAGMAQRESDGVVFAGEGDDDNFHRVDGTTGAATEVATSGIGDWSGRGLTFANDGTLYMAADDSLYTIDPDIPQSTSVGVITYTGFPTFSTSTIDVISLTTRAEDGVVFGILKDGGSTGDTYLVTVNLATAEVTNVGLTTVWMDGLAFVPASLFP